MSILLYVCSTWTNKMLREKVKWELYKDNVFNKLWKQYPTKQ